MSHESQISKVRLSGAGLRRGLVCLAKSQGIAWPIFYFFLCRFLFFTWWTLDQPIVDMWGFRPAQTTISVQYMLHAELGRAFVDSPDAIRGARPVVR
jgi:hypothetical protein